MRNVAHMEIFRNIDRRERRRRDFLEENRKLV
jgi:hypothetical protein